MQTTETGSSGDLSSASPAPFLKTLKAPRPAESASSAPSTPSAPERVASGSAAASRPVVTATAEELDALSDLSTSDESFESATTVISRAVLAHRDVEREGDSTPIAAAKPPPPLEDVVAKVPAETKDALEQLFRARFRAVRRITPDQLR